MSWHLSVRHSIGRLLQSQGLKVHTQAPVWDDEVWIHRTLHTTRLLTMKEEENLHTIFLSQNYKCVDWPYLLRHATDRNDRWLKLTCCTCGAKHSPAGRVAEECYWWQNGTLCTAGILLWLLPWLLRRRWWYQESLPDGTPAQTVVKITNTIDTERTVTAILVYRYIHAFHEWGQILLVRKNY